MAILIIYEFPSSPQTVSTVRIKLPSRVLPPLALVFKNITDL